MTWRPHAGIFLILCFRETWMKRCSEPAVGNRSRKQHGAAYAKGAGSGTSSTSITEWIAVPLSSISRPISGPPSNRPLLDPGSHSGIAVDAHHLSGGNALGGGLDDDGGNAQVPGHHSAVRKSAAALHDQAGGVDEQRRPTRVRGRADQHIAGRKALALCRVENDRRRTGARSGGDTRPLE